MQETWLSVLVIAIAINAWLRWWTDRRHEKELRVVLKMLRIWAQTWGESPETVKPKLLEALKS